MQSFHHITVLLNETVESLGDITGKVVVDATLGGGGHTKKLLSAVGPHGCVIAIDRDHDALKHAAERFKDELAAGNLLLFDGPFSAIKDVPSFYFDKTNKKPIISGIIADIGVSSHQIDVAERGFSFMKDGPLDMRMNGRSGQTAADFLSTASESEIADVIYYFGEEVKAKQIARLIVKERDAGRRLVTTKDLADLIQNARLWGHAPSKKHPATKTFQGLRIYINEELEELKTLLRDGFEILDSSACFSVISFHSLEDRIIKDTFQGFCGKTKNQNLPREIPVTYEELQKSKNIRAKIIGDFPEVPSSEEASANPRARSAKLRTVMKLY